MNASVTMQKIRIKLHRKIFQSINPANIRLDEAVLKRSSRRLDQDLYICLGHTSSRRHQDIFKTSSRRLQDVLPRRLQDVLQKRLQDIFKMSC